MDIQYHHIYYMSNRKDQTVIYYKMSIYNIETYFREVIMKKKYINIFFLAIIILLEILYWIIMIITRSHFLDGYFINDFTNTSMDYFNMLANLQTLDPYASNANYPALCFVIWRVLYHMVPQLEGIVDGYFLREYMPAQLGYIIYLTIIIISIWQLIQYKFRQSVVEKYLVAIALLLSGPFIFTLERGNIIILSFLFLFFFYCFYDSEKKIVRYTAYIALALSASIKIYPAVFGIIILLKKRYKEAAVAVIIGIFIFLLSFFAFDGIQSLLDMLNGIFAANELQSNAGMGLNFCASNLVKIFAALGGKLLVEVSFGAKITSLLICILIFFLNQEEWKRLFALSLLCIWIPEFSYTYVLILMFIPFISLIAVKKEIYCTMDYVYRILFAFMLIPIALPAIPEMDFAGVRLPITYPTIIINLDILIMSIALLIQGIINTLKSKVKVRSKV